jgi:hypothetical protein
MLSPKVSQGDALGWNELPLWGNGNDHGRQLHAINNWIESGSLNICQWSMKVWEIIQMDLESKSVF